MWCLRVPGTGTRRPYPVEMAERLVRMFSFAGDTVHDPFAGSGRTALAAIACGRSSISIEIEPIYADIALGKITQAARAVRLWDPTCVELIDNLSAASDRVLRTPRGRGLSGVALSSKGLEPTTVETLDVLPSGLGRRWHEFIAAMAGA